MIVFPWLVLTLVLLLLAELLIVLPEALRGLLVNHHILITRPPARLVAAFTLIELLFVVIWGDFLRPR